jgi:hypothetical protein
MIVISFVIGKTPEEKAHQLLQQITDQIISQMDKIIPNTLMNASTWIYRRESDKPGEPSIALITDTLEKYLLVSAKSVDEPDHLTWIFSIECPNHAIAIPEIDKPKFHILNPDQVSKLFNEIAKKLSNIVAVEVGYNNDHTRTGIIYKQGKATKEEHW